MTFGSFTQVFFGNSMNFRIHEHLSQFHTFYFSSRKFSNVIDLFELSKYCLTWRDILLVRKCVNRCSCCKSETCKNSLPKLNICKKVQHRYAQSDSRIKEIVNDCQHLRNPLNSQQFQITAKVIHSNPR